MSSRIAAALSCALFLSVPACDAQSSAGTNNLASQKPAYASDPKFAAAMAEAKQLSARRDFGFAEDAYKKANKIAGGRCFECLYGLYTVQMKGASFKDAVNTASQLEELAATPRTKSTMEYLRADAVYLGAGEKPKREKLEAAHGVLAEALANYPKNAAALFLDGQILAQLGRMDEAKADFSQCVSCVDPNDPGKLRAQHFAENPELALHKMAPAFEVTALDGSKFNLDAMGGRVVLIDFWATWCGPCNREIPHMQAIAKQFAGQPLVMISVSLDKDEAKWKDFVAKHGMTWEQYRDADGKLGEAFGVTTIPRYFTIDSDGVLTSVLVDEGSDVEGHLKKLVARAREAQTQSAEVKTMKNHAPGD